MRASAFHITTLKEAPNDAEIASHRLMMRSGMIRKLAGGIYNYMPLGLRVIRKIENIIRQEMDAAGALELLMPVVQPAELWMESGRWEQYGPELLRIKDRHGRDFVLQPLPKRSSPISHAMKYKAGVNYQLIFITSKLNFAMKDAPVLV